MKRHRQSFSLPSTPHIVARWRNNSAGRSTWPSWPRGNAHVAVEEIEITPEMRVQSPVSGIGRDGFDEREAGQRGTMVNISSV
jgi:hypothetical protein